MQVLSFSAHSKRKRAHACAHACMRVRVFDESTVFASHESERARESASERASEYFQEPETKRESERESERVYRCIHVP